MSDMIAPTRPRLSKQERQWRAQDALRTLAAADQIKKDTGLMRDVQTEAKRQMQTLSRVAPKKR